MAEINVTDLKKQLDSGSFAPLYLFYGEESYLVNTYARRLTDKIVDKNTAAFNLHRFEADETEIDDVLEALSMYPFMAERNLTVLVDLNVDTLSAQDKKKLFDYFETPNPSAVFLMYYPSHEGGKKSAKWNEFLKAVKKNGVTVNFEKKTQAETEKLLCSYAAKLKCELSRSDAAYLISVSKNDLQTLFSELDKLCAYSGSNEITREMIDKVVSFNTETTVFVLSRALIQGELDKAYSLLDVLFNQNEKALSVLGALSSSYIDLYRVKTAILSGYQPRYVGEVFSYKGREFVLDNAGRSVRALSDNAIRKSIQLLSDTDILLKSTSQENHRRILEEMFAKLQQLRVEG